MVSSVTKNRAWPERWRPKLKWINVNTASRLLSYSEHHFKATGWPRWNFGPVWFQANRLIKQGLHLNWCSEFWFSTVPVKCPGPHEGPLVPRCLDSRSSGWVKWECRQKIWKDRRVARLQQSWPIFLPLSVMWCSRKRRTTAPHLAHENPIRILWSTKMFKMSSSSIISVINSLPN